MAFTVYEMWDSRNSSLGLKQQSMTLKWVGYGTLDEDVARTGFIAVIPLTFLGLLLENDISIRAAGGELWYAEATYSSTATAVESGQGGVSPPPPPPATPAATDPLGPEYSWDISAVTDHITQSKETVTKKTLATLEAMGQTAPNNNRAIGITADGEVQGCDVFKPHFEWSITRTFGYVTHGYLMTLKSLVGKRNDATFYLRSPGTLIFMGASGTPKGSDGQVAVTFKFLEGSDEENIEIAGTDTSDDGYIGQIDKAAWDYLWVAYRNAQSENKITQQPFAVYVERVFDEGDFSLLGLGT
jgi:hypothetical protein